MDQMMKTNEFHEPFIKSLLIISIVTVVAMVSSHYFIDRLYSKYYKTPVFTSSDSYISSKSLSDEPFDK
jgi:hypothetical protein